MFASLQSSRDVSLGTSAAATELVIASIKRSATAFSVDSKVFHISSDSILKNENHFAQKIKFSLTGFSRKKS